jgi:hypothetical protein
MKHLLNAFKWTLWAVFLVWGEIAILSGDSNYKYAGGILYLFMFLGILVILLEVPSEQDDPHHKM